MDYHILHFIQDILRQICGVYLVLLLANPPVSENSPLIKSCKVVTLYHVFISRFGHVSNCSKYTEDIVT